MIKKLTSFLEYGIFAETALAIFVVVFIAILIHTLMLRREVSEEHASIVLRDNPKETP